MQGRFMRHALDEWRNICVPSCLWAVRMPERSAGCSPSCLWLYGVTKCVSVEFGFVDVLSAIMFRLSPPRPTCKLVELELSIAQPCIETEAHPGAPSSTTIAAAAATVPVLLLLLLLLAWHDPVVRGQHGRRQLVANG
jgi:hypothetical protein